MATENPTLILVHGGFHNPSCFYLIKPKLEALSYTVLTPHLPTSRGLSPTATLTDDVTAILEAITPSLNAGKEIVLIAHSYGGTPACVSTSGQTIAERAARGEKGGIKAILFIASILVSRRGMSLSGSGGGGGGAIPYMDVQGPYGVLNEKAKEIFYNDAPNDIRDTMMKEGTGIQQAFGGFMAPVEFVPTDLTIPATYLMCENDKCVPVSAQEGYVAGVPGMRSERCGAGHSPMLSQPERMVEVIVKVASG